MFSLYLFLGCSIFSLSGVIAFERQLGVLNFTCSNTTHTRLDKLIVVEAKGERDVLYHFWDFGSKPTFFTVQVPLRTRVELDCSRFIKNEYSSIKFTSEPLFVFGVMLNKLFEFNDEDDTATFNSSDTTIRTYNSEDFLWNVSFSQNTRPIPLDAFKASGKPFNSTSNGMLEVAVGAYTGDGPSVEPPHLLHTSNGSQVDIVLNNFATIFNKSRFAVQFITFSSVVDLNYTSTVEKMDDDENTPGEFKLNSINFDRPKRFKSDNRGYLLWLPLVFTNEEKAVTHSTGSKQYNVTDVQNELKLFDGTLLTAIYGKKAASLFAKSVVISFGSKTDKFYQSTKYSCWSFVFGTGEPPNFYANSLMYLVIFSVCIIVSVVLAVLVALKLMKLPGFLTAGSGSHEVLVNDE